MKKINLLIFVLMCIFLIGFFVCFGLEGTESVKAPNQPMGIYGWLGILSLALSAMFLFINMVINTNIVGSRFTKRKNLHKKNGPSIGPPGFSC